MSPFLPSFFFCSLLLLVSESRVGGWVGSSPFLSFFLTLFLYVKNRVRLATWWWEELPRLGPSDGK